MDVLTRSLRSGQRSSSMFFDEKALKDISERSKPQILTMVACYLCREIGIKKRYRATYASGVL